MMGIGTRAVCSPDSLRRQLISTTSDSARGQIAWTLAVYYEPEQTDSCLYYLYQSLGSMQRAGNTSGVARAMHRLGHMYLYVVKDEARAIHWITKAKAIATRHNDHRHLAACYQLLCVVAVHQRMQSLPELMNLALLHAQKTNDWEVRADVYGLCSEINILQQRYSQAKPYCLRTMHIYEQHDVDRWITIGLDYCKILQAQGQHKQALAVARRLAAAKSKLRQSRGFFIYSNDMAQLAIFLKQYDEAESYLLKGLSHEQKRVKPDTLHLLHYYRTLTELYLAQNDYKRAYGLSKTINQIQLWLQRVRQTRDAKIQVAELKAAVAIERKEKELATLETKQRQQRIYNLIVFSVSVLLLSFLIVLFHSRWRIERQRIQLMQLNQTKDKLFTILSHDLRSPVAGLKNFIALHDWGVLSKAEFNQSVQSLSDRLTQVSNLLESLLSWSVAQLGGLRAEPAVVSLSAIVAQEIRLLQTVADDKRIDLRSALPENLCAFADPNHLSIIIRNLLQNAVKFTRPGGSIAVAHKYHRHKICLIITDTGVGIPADTLTTLFTLSRKSVRFGTRNEPGLGIGLNFVKELVDANKAEIQVESSENEGTTFRLYLQRDYKYEPTEAETVGHTVESI
ncbi:ATP-binding protein [Spirosoma montaniterrae]|nr:ATP-binding protein [Spirosoma montaniterrae]